jgi:hypothetical protein
MNNENVKENVIAGIVGAFLFALAGGVLWFVLYLFGFIAGISGLIGAVCAVKGYSIFAKKESIKGVVISVVIALLVIVIAWYLCIGYDVWDIHKYWYETGEIDYTLTYSESVRAVSYYLADPEIGPSYYGDLAIGLVFCVVGGGSFVWNKIKGIKAQQSAPKHETEEQ